MYKKAEIEAKLEEVRVLQKAAKKEFVAFTQNTEIGLEERWEMFLSAPEYLKDHRELIQHFEVEKKLLSSSISWYDEFSTDKYQEVNLGDVIENIEDNPEYFEKELGFTKELVQEFKEEILQKNLGSFVFDW